MSYAHRRAIAQRNTFARAYASLLRRSTSQGKAVYDHLTGPPDALRAAIGDVLTGVHVVTVNR